MIVTLKEREEVQLCKAEQAAINDTNQLQCNKQIRQEMSFWQVHTAKPGRARSRLIMRAHRTNFWIISMENVAAQYLNLMYQSDGFHRYLTDRWGCDSRVDSPG